LKKMTPVWKALSFYQNGRFCITFPHCFPCINRISLIVSFFHRTIVSRHCPAIWYQTLHHDLINCADYWIEIWCLLSAVIWQNDNAFHTGVIFFNYELLLIFMFGNYLSVMKSDCSSVIILSFFTILLLWLKQFPY
jgi:hypothetical protein